MKNSVIEGIRHFLLLRKQNDTVKLICLFVLTGVVFLIFMGYCTWGIFRYMETPAEYILSGDGVVSGQRVRELRQSEDISEVSRQIETSVSVWYGGCETTVECTMLSPEYIAGLSGTEIPAGGSRIYMNEAAFSEFQAAISGDASYRESDGLKEGSQELTVRYSLGEDAMTVGGGSSDDGTAGGTETTAVVRNSRSAKLIVIQTTGEEAESFIYTPETERKLLREAVSLRVRFRTHDLDGLHVENLRKLGYEIENEGMILEEEYEMQTTLLHIRYGLLICGICIAAVFALAKSAKETVYSIDADNKK